MQEADNGDRLLRAHRERPCRHRTAGKCDELAPPHYRPWAENSVLTSILEGAARNPRTMSALGQKRTCAVQKGMSALPPKATLNASFECPLGANSGLMRCINYRSVVGAFEHRRRDILPERSSG